MRRFAFALAVFAVPFAVSAQTAPQQPQTGTAPAAVISQPTQLGTALQQPQTLTTQTTTQAGQIGQHLQTVTPEHPLEHGAHFGECVSEMAITGVCLDDHEQ